MHGSIAEISRPLLRKIAISIIEVSGKTVDAEEFVLGML